MTVKNTHFAFGPPWYRPNSVSKKLWLVYIQRSLNCLLCVTFQSSKENKVLSIAATYTHPLLQRKCFLLQTKGILTSTHKVVLAWVHCHPTPGHMGFTVNLQKDIHPNLSYSVRNKAEEVVVRLEIDSPGWTMGFHAWLPSRPLHQS